MTSNYISGFLPILTAIGLSIIALAGCRLATWKKVRPEQTTGLALLIVSLLGIPFAALSITAASAGFFFRDFQSIPHLATPWLAGHAFLITVLAVFAGLGTPSNSGGREDFIEVIQAFVEWTSDLRRYAEKWGIPILLIATPLMGLETTLSIVLALWGGVVLTHAMTDIIMEEPQ